MACNNPMDFRYCFFSIPTDFDQFSNSQLIHSKGNLKRNLSIELEENHYSHYLLKESLRKPKISLRNLDFQQFSCSEQLQSRHLKGDFYMPLKTLVRAVFQDTHLQKLKFRYQIWSSINFSIVND